MSRVHKKDLRFMKDNKTFALDTLSGVELLQSAEICLNQSSGNPQYQDLARKIVMDAKHKPNLYITGKMRRVLMGYIRPVFEQEWGKRQKGMLPKPK